MKLQSNRPPTDQWKEVMKFGGGLSSIVENSDRKSLANKAVVVRQNLLGEDSSSSTSASTSLLRRNIREFEEQNLSQTTESKEEENELSTTYDPNEAVAEDGQRNDTESSHDLDKTQVSVTKDDSEEMSATFDVGDQEKTQTVVMRNESDNSTLYLALACCLLLKVLSEMIQVVW